MNDGSLAQPQPRRDRQRQVSPPGPRDDTPLFTRADFSGLVLCALGRRNEIERILPPPLRLAPQHDDEDTHPILFALGRQTNCRTRLGATDVTWSFDYEELLIAVPFVSTPRTSSLGVFVPRAYSSYYASNWEGRFAYGFDKQVGNVEHRPPLHWCTTPGAGMTLQATVEASEPWRPPGDAPDALRALERIARLPWLGRAPSGALLRSRTHWDIERATARTIEASILLHPALGLDLGRLTPLHRGSVEVRGMTWWLGWPRRVAV